MEDLSSLALFRGDETQALVLARMRAGFLPVLDFVPALSLAAILWFGGHQVLDGTLGPIRLVQVEYIQAGMATRLEDGPKNNRLNWVLDPKRSGLALVMGAIGCHAQQLACFAVDENIARVVADVRSLMPGRKLVFTAGTRAHAWDRRLAPWASCRV